MGFDNDCILNIQSLAGEYFCPVCHLLVYPNEALQAPCTHLYCKPCLTYVVSTNHACPYDGYRVTEADSKPLLESNKTLADTIGKIQVHCLYYRTGCTWQGALSDCSSHCSTCAFGESPVLCNRCGIQIVHRQVQEHAQNCPGVPSQAQPGGAQGQDATSTGAGAASDQSQPAAQSGAPASQAQTSQASALPVSSQDTNQPANSATQPQAAQAAVPTPEQWYQQQQQYQQQYQQYYQQYPGYDPYQQHYQYYYQYPQAAQQYQQQPMQAYGQAQPQVYGQAPTQPQLVAQPQVQSHVQAPHPQQQPQAPSEAVQSQPQPQAQPAVNTQPQVQPVGQAHSQMHAQSQGPPSHPIPYNQSQPLPAQAQGTQPHAQPHPVPQQQMQVPQYQQNHPQMHHPHPQPYPQSQAQNYPYPQTQSQVHPPLHSQPNPQAPAHPLSQPNQPINPSAQLQTQNAVTGYQSYPQLQQNPQARVGAAQQMQATGVHQQPQYPSQMQGQFPSQASQIRMPQPYAAVPNQQQSAMVSAQGQAPMGPPAQQQPVYTHAQQAGYPFPQRPGVQAAQQAGPQQYVQQQSYPGQGPFMQAPLHAQGSSQIQPPPQQNYAAPLGALPTMAQNHAGRHMAPQGAVPQPYAQAQGLASAGQVRPAQLNQSYPMRANHQLSVASEPPVNPQKSLRTADGEKPRDQTLEKGVQDQDVRSKEARNIPGASETGLNEAADGNESKRDLSLESAGELPGSKQVLGTESKLLDNDVQEGNPRLKEDTAEGISAPSASGKAAKGGVEDVKKAEVQDLKHIVKGKVGTSASASMLPQSHLAPQGHGSNSFSSTDLGRSQLQSMPYGPPAQPRPGVPSMPHAMAHAGNPQQPALVGQPPNQLKPQGPGQVPPGLPFNAVDNSQSSILPHPGSSVRPGNAGHYQGNFPPYQAGQPQNPHGEPFIRPSFDAQWPGVFDSHGGVVRREPLPRPDFVEPHPPYPPETEKFPPQRPGYFDGRLSDPHPHGPIERGSYGPVPPPIVQPGASKFNGPLGHDSMPAPGMRDERFKQFNEEHFKSFARREFEDDLRKFPRPSHLEAGPSSKFGSQFPASEPLDQGPHMFGVDGLSRPFDKGPHGLDRDSGLKVDSGIGSGPSRFLPPFHPNDVGMRDRAAGFPDDNTGRANFGRRPGLAPEPEFGRHRIDGLPPRSPGRGYAGFPSRTVGAYRDVDGNDSRSFEGSKPYGFPAEPFGKSIHDSRFPIPPNHMRMSELDGPGNLHMGDHLTGGPHNQDMLPSHLRRGEHMGPRNLHLGDGTDFGHSRMGEPPLRGNFPPHVPFGESFGAEKPTHPLVGEPGFRSNFAYQRFARDGGFYAEELEPFDNPRKRKPGSIMCRICKVECGTVEGLDLHSQSREHQRKAMDMVLSIKQQNKKKQRTSNDQGPVGGGRDGNKLKTSSFGGRGNKR